ncbi:MAG TPA: ABC transporter substrate-binding protein [Solirubrobacterales bacterium]|nr:ABC transporter substrate-binding protein [Solirubrobacterales bacterium]
MGIAVVGCGNSGSDSESTGGSETTAETTGEATTAAAPSKDLSGQSLTYVSFGGNLQEAESEAIVQPWAKENGVKVAEESPTDYAKLTAQVETGNVTWDVVHADPFFLAANCGTLFDELSPSTVPSLSEIPSELVSSKCEVPHMRYGIGLYYDAKKFGSNPPTTWADFFNTKKYPGKRGAWGYAQSGLLEAALLAEGVSKESLYPLDTEKAFKKLDTIKGDMKFATAPGEVAQQVTSGEITMALIYTGRAYEAAVQKADWKMAWGAPTITSYEAVGIVKGSPDEEASLSLVNAFGEAEPQARFAELIAYAPTNPAAKPNLDPLLKEYSIASHPESGYVALDQGWWAENFDKVNTEFTEWLAG